MWLRSTAFASLVLLGGCLDAAPLAPGGEQAEPTAPQLNNTPIDSEVRTYWRTSDTLWVYGSEPEVGLGSGNGSPAAMSHVANSGSRLVRFTLYWDDYMEDAAYGPYRIHELNWVVQNAKNAGLEPVVVIHGGGGGGNGNPPGIDMLNAWQNMSQFNSRFEAFVEEAVQVLPDVRFWEIWNEADAGWWAQPFGAWNGSGFNRYEQGTRYASTLKVAYEAIKANDPGDWVLVTSLTGAESFHDDDGDGVWEVGGPTSWDFLRGLYDAGGGSYYDFMNVHAYGPEPTGGSTYNRAPDWIGAELRSQVQSLEGKSGRPIWLTEFGAAAGTYVDSHGTTPDSLYEYDLHQRDWWMGALDVIAAPGSPYTKAIGYTLWSDDYSLGLGPRYGHGIMYGSWSSPSSWQPRPAYTALQSRGFNAHVFAQPVLNGAVTVYAPNKNPVGYSYTRSGNFVTITGVSVDKLFPTKIPFTATIVNPGGGCDDPSQIICDDNDPW